MTEYQYLKFITMYCIEHGNFIPYEPSGIASVLYWKEYGDANKN